MNSRRLNRRSFFRFLAVAPVAAPIAILAASAAPAWGEGIPAILNAWKSVPAEKPGELLISYRYGFFHPSRAMTVAEKTKFIERFITDVAEPGSSSRLAFHRSAA